MPNSYEKESALKKATQKLRVKLLLMKADNKIEKDLEAKRNRGVFAKLLDWIKS